MSTSHASPVAGETPTSSGFQNLDTTVPTKLMNHMHREAKIAGMSLGAWVRVTLWSAVDEARSEK